MDKYAERGLDEERVRSLQEKYGRNLLVGRKPPTDWDFLVAQFKNPLVIVLMVAGLVTLGFKEFTDTIVIGLAVAVNTVLGFVQERNAQRGLEALKKVLTSHSEVIRDGKKQTIDSRDLVPGDVVLLYEGDKVPADGVLIEEVDLLVNEAILTGESVPVAKEAVELKLIKGGKGNEVGQGPAPRG